MVHFTPSNSSARPMPHTKQEKTYLEKFDKSAFSWYTVFKRTNVRKGTQ